MDEEQEEEFYGEKDFFEIYFIKSYPKSLTTKYQNSFTVKTSGLLIRDVQTLDVLTLQFLPANWEKCFFPVIQILDNGVAGHVAWDMTGQLVEKSTFEITEYEQALYLGSMNGVVRTTFLDWVHEEFKNKKQNFSPISVCEYASPSINPTVEDDLACPVRVNNWDSFVERSLEILAGFDVKMSSVIPPMGSRFLVQCSSVSERILYRTDLPSYYQSFYQCMEGHSDLAYVTAVNTCATSEVQNLGGYNYINIGSKHYVRCGLGKADENVGLFASETYYTLPIPSPSEPYTYEADRSTLDVLVAVTIVAFLIGGLFAVVGKGYYTSKKRIDKLKIRSRPARSTRDHSGGMMDDLDNTEHDKKLHSFENEALETNMEVSSYTQSSTGHRSIKNKNGKLFHHMISKVKNKSNGKGDSAKYSSLTTVDDDDEDI